MPANELTFDILSDDRASANISRVGRSMRAMSADVELANVRMERATRAASVAVERYGRDSLEAREALARLARAEDQAEVAARRLGAAQRRAAAETEAAGEAAETAGEATEEAGGKLEGFKTAAAAAGGAAAAAIGKGFLDNLSIEAGRAKLAAQLGLTTEEASRAGQLAGDVYQGNFGDSMESVNDALRIVWSSMRAIGQDSPELIESTTKAALTLSDVFDVDVSESVRAATRLIQTGLVENSTEAFDLMAKGFQEGSGQADDLLDTLTEYSVQFQKLGMSGVDAMSLLSQGLKAGALDTDKIADAVAEFTKLALDGNANTAAGFRSLGLDAKNTAAVIASGGPAARDTFAQILEALSSVKDPLKQNAIGLQLFGTMWEDLGPQVVTSLSLTDNAIGNTSGAIEKMNNTLGDTGAARLETLRRRLEGLVQSAASAPGALGAAAAGVAVIGPSAVETAGNLGMMVMGFQALNLHGERARGVLKGVGIAAAALAAAQASGAIFGGDAGVKGIETTTKALREMASGSQDTTGALKHLDEDLANLGTTGRSFGGFLEGLTGNFAGLAGDGSVSAVNARIASLDATLTSLVSSGKADQAASMFSMISAKAQEQGTSLEELNRAFPQYQNALDGATQANVSAGNAAGATAGSVKAQADATNELTAALDANQNKLLQLSGGEIGYYAAVDAATAALQKNGKGLKATTEAGRENQTALNNQAKAALGYLSAMQQQGVPAAQFNALLAQSRAQLIAAARSFGMGKDKADEYANSILGIPKQADTKVTASTAQARADVGLFRRALSDVPVGVGTVLRADKATAQRNVQSYSAFLRDVPGSTYTRATFDISGAMASRNRWMGALASLPSGIPSSIRARATGGILPGPPSRKDNMLIAAASGEYVVNAQQTSRHLATLEAINSGRYRGFASGGAVGPMRMPAIVPAFGGSGAVSVQLNTYGPIGSQAQLEDWLQRAVVNLQRKGRL